MYTFKNITDQTLEIPLVGIVKPGQNISSDTILYSANLEFVKTEVQTKTQPAQAQPATITPPVTVPVTATEGAS